MSFIDIVEFSSLKDVLTHSTPKGWEYFFQSVEPEITKISEEIEKRKKVIDIYPPIHRVFNAFYYSSPQQIRIVIVGQDCYHNLGAATGLAFDVGGGNSINPSLKNIAKEVKNSGFEVDISSGDLINWAEQHVFLINTALTVEKGKPESHLRLWEEFSYELLKYISNLDQPIGWLLFGAKAQKFSPLIDKPNHYMIKTSHPSPLSATSGANPFIGSRCFYNMNKWLERIKEKPIDWSIRKN
jgi:uracil-DNA glycosylase